MNPLNFVLSSPIAYNKTTTSNIVAPSHQNWEKQTKELGPKLTTLLRRELHGYLLIKKSFVKSNELLKSKNMNWSFD
jgi:hypothetical protein